MPATELAETYRGLAAGFFDPALEAERLRVFGHTGGSDCPPCEAQWGPPETFRQAHLLADLAGFYRAWGVRAAAGLGERLDHIGVELEFAGFLAWKEASAEAEGDAAHASLARDARRRFLEEHLGAWAPHFARRLAGVAGEGPCAVLAREVEAAVAADARALGVAPQPLLSPLPVAAAPPPEDPEDGCAACGDAVP